MARRDFRAACRYFDSIQEVWSGKSDLDSGIMMRLGADAFCSSENLPRALTLIRIAITVLSRNTGETTELAECYVILGNVMRYMGKFREAEEAYRDAESIFRRNDDYSRAGVALNRLAAIHFRKGEFDSALKCLLEAVEHARKEDDNKKLAYIFGNIGRVYTLMGRLSQAEENIRFNIELSTQLGDDVELARAYLSLGYINIQQIRFDTAAEALATALVYIRKQDMRKEDVIYLTYLGELLIKTGRLSEAERVLNEAASGGSKISPESLLAARPLRHLAELMLKQGNFRKALLVANKAMILMKKLEDSVEIGALLKIQAICYQNLEQPDKARVAFVDSIALLEEYKAKFELAESLIEAGRSPLFGANQQTMYLCRAEEVYNACGIIPRATELQKMIGNLDAGPAAQIAVTSQTEVAAVDFPTRNEKMKQIVRHLKLLRNSDIPILLTGETGTGKDFLARYYHSIVRPDGPFVTVNCAAMPETLMESELFGCSRGAYTGAESDRRGLFLAANHGVLLLDEIGELTPALQAKLLSVLESKKLRPLGTSDEIPFDTIVIAATNRDLNIMVENGTFRRDLYYRLTGITLELPPLRERKEDIPHLLDYFMHKFGLIDNGQSPDRELVRLFVGYDWPGNIRQLENKVRQLSVMASMAKDGSIVELSRSFFDSRKDEVSNSLFEQVEQFEKRLLIEALASAGGNKSEAARLLSIHESTFRAKMKRYSLTA